MKSSNNFVASLLCTVMLFLPSVAFAQSSFFDVEAFRGEPVPTSDGSFTVDSFFDVDFQIDLCNPCEAIRKDIDATMEKIEGLETDLQVLDELMTALEEDMAETNEQLTDLQQRLEEFNDPQNYVESEGRRYDSSDHAAMQRRSAQLWSDYQTGDITAQEYGEEIAKPFDDPEVQRELSKLKKKIRKDMEQQIKDLKEQQADQDSKHQEWDELGQEMTDELDVLDIELEQLRLALEDCLKLCAEPESVDLTDPFGLPVPEPGFFDGLFGGLFGGPPQILPPLPPLPDPSTSDVPTEMLPMGLSGPPLPLPLPEPPLVPEQPLPPATCRVCDPIREQINELEASLSGLRWDQLMADILVELLYDEKANRQQMKDQLEQDLNELRNPSDFVESEGRRYDGADHAAMQVRNARLWAEYKDGNVSAQELSEEWAKPFDDPEVQEELEDIKEQMEEEMEERIEDLAEQIEELDKEIEETTDFLVDLAGRIAAHQSVLESLYRDLEECEKKCQQPTEEDMALIADFDELVRDIGVTLRQATTGIQVLPDDEDDLDMDSEFELSSSSASDEGSSEPEDTTGEDDDDADSMELRTGYVEDEGYLCGLPLINKWTCPTDDLMDDDDDMEDYEDEDDMDDIGVARGGFLCNSFNLFCPKTELNLDTFIGCLENSGGSNCDQFIDTVEDDDDTGTLFQDFDPYLTGPGGVEFPLIINGFDGDDSLSAQDFEGLNNCLQNGPPACGPLDFETPNTDVLFGGDLFGTTGPGMQVGLRGPDGNDILLGDPVPDDFINIGGGSNDVLFGGPGTLSDNLIGPGNDDIIGGPPSVGLFGENGNDLIGDPPPPPTQPQQDMQNDPQVRQVVQAAVQRYLQNNPLQECEKLQVQVSRVRIGNKVRYTVRITRVRDESLCPPPPIAECPAETSYQSIGTGCEACQNGTAGCTVIETLPDGINCILCAPPSDTDDEDDIDLGCQYDSDCNDGDECTDDRCDRYTGECTNVEREGCRDPVCGDGVKQPSEECEGGDSAYCGENELCTEQCTCEPVPRSDPKCPDFAHETQSSCESVCDGECQNRDFEGAQCFFCVPTDLQESSSSSASSERSVEEQCDSPTMKKADCERSCDGKCDRAYKTISGTECYECEEFEDTGPSCPDGMTGSLSDCQSQCGAQGGTCVDEDQTGCYSCVVVNCPDGSSKECPSSCSNGCEKVGEQYGVSCYQCKQSCEDVCAQNGYGGPNTDHSSAILSELNGYSCVSGASISIQTATIGSCSCIGEYSLSVNQTPPVCTGTPCGDVTCGDSATCTEGDTTITVNCNWGGWEQIDKHQFRPVVGN